MRKKILGKYGGSPFGGQSRGQKNFGGASRKKKKPKMAQTPPQAGSHKALVREGQTLFPKKVRHFLHSGVMRIFGGSTLTPNGRADPRWCPPGSRPGANSALKAHTPLASTCWGWDGTHTGVELQGVWEVRRHLFATAITAATTTASGVPQGGIWGRPRFWGGFFSTLDGTICSTQEKKRKL